MNKFDKPYRIAPAFDSKKNLEMFDLASKLDTHELLQYSLINQIPFDITDDDGNSLIHIVISVDPRKASPHSKLSVIKFLVNNGVNPDRPNKYNQTPLHLACQQQSTLIVKYLLDINVDANFKDNMGLTPFHYLLTGDITTIVNTGEIMNFVPEPRNVDVKKNDKMIEVKKEIYNLLIAQLIKDEFPILVTIDQTIKNILDNDKEIISMRVDLEKQIAKIGQNTSSAPNLLEIKTTVEIYLNSIKKKITKLFNDLPDLDGLVIHQTEPTSWAHPSNSKPMSLIKNGNIKRVVKDSILQSKENIEKLDATFKPYSDSEYTTNPDNTFLEEIMEFYTEELKLKESQNNFAYFDDVFAVKSSYFNAYAYINNLIKHSGAIDNASSIVNFKSLKYAGGPRNIKVIFPINPKAPKNPPELIDIFNELKTIDNLTETQKILYMLGSPVQLSTLIGKIPKDYDILKDLDDVIKHFVQDLVTPVNWLDSNGTPIIRGQVDGNLLETMFFYIIFAYTAIAHLEKFNELELKLSNMKFKVRFVINNNAFANKWYSKLKEGAEIAPWLYGMWCDISCMLSDSNLDGHVHFRTLMLVASLSEGKKDLKQSIINAYKPHLMALINNIQIGGSSLKPEVIITKMALVLLNTTINSQFLRDIDKDLKLEYIDTIQTDTNVKLLGKLLFEYFSTPDPATFDPKSSTDEDKLYISYKYPGQKPIQILAKIILNIYDQLINKPLKQTVIDFIYLIINYNQLLPSKDTTSFDEISILGLKFDKHYQIDMTRNILPSKYGIENLYIETNNLDLTDQFIEFKKSHFMVAHILGLYFEGIINSNNYKMNDPFSIHIGQNTIDFHPICEDGGGGVIQQDTSNFHELFNYDSLNRYTVPLPFNFIELDPAIPGNFPIEGKFHYYNCKDKLLIMPSIHSYFLMICKRIKYYQEKIYWLLKEVNTITTELVNGKTNKLKVLYTQLYPKIVAFSKIADSFIDSYNEIESLHGKNLIWKDSDIKKKFPTPAKYPFNNLAIDINNINSQYFLYYYIYSPNKLIKLSRFNYYQLPTSLTVPHIYFFKEKISDDGNFFRKEEIKELTGVDTETKITEDKLNSGFINQFSLGNYNSFLQEYMSGQFNTIRNVKDEFFIIDKNNRLPPSLHSSLQYFYSYTLIELIKRAITEIDTNKAGLTNNLYNKLQLIVKSSKINVDDYDLTSYNIVSKLVQEILKEQYSIYINNEVSNTFNKIIISISLPPSIPSSQIFTKKEMAISIDKTDVDFSKINIEGVKNLYNLLIQPTKSDMFVLYPNDLTNVNRLRTKYGVVINNEIIELLLKKAGSPYHLNLESQTPIYGLLKNYNFAPIKNLKTLGIDFRIFEGETPSNFIKRELDNNFDKVLGGNFINSKLTKDLLSNFDNYLYNDVKTLILSNDAYGNNILSYLPLSFNISTYIVLQYLLESLINTDDDYSLDDLTEFLKFIQVDINDINKNFLGETLGSFNIPDSFENHVAQEFLKEKKELKQNLEKEIKTMDANINKLKISNPTLATKMETTSKYIDISKDITKIAADINSINAFFLSVGITTLPNKSVPDYKIISRYRKLGEPNIHNVLITDGWKKLFDQQYTTNNYNLGLIQLIKEEKQLVDTLNLNNLDELRKISKTLKKLSEVGESYFSSAKFTDQNKVAHFVRDMLEYLTELTICTGLEMVIRRILFTYFSNSLPDEELININNINARIDYILETTSYGLNKSLLDIIKDEIAPELAKNASEIFDNRAEEQGYYNRPTREVLLNFFQQLENSPVKLSNEILNVFNKDVVSYFDTFTTRTILLWQVNAENIFKYFINNYRCVETLISL